MLAAAIALLFLYTALGMLVAAFGADPPTGPGFWRLTVLLILAGITIGLGLRLSPLGAAAPPLGTPALIGWAFCVGALIAFGSLFAFREQSVRAVLGVATLAGAAGVALDPAFAPADLPRLEAALYTLGMATVATALGSVLLAMILAHWYLIEPRLPIEPLERVLRLFLGTEALKAALLVGVVVVHWDEWAGADGGLLRAFVLGDALFVGVRAVLGVAAPIALGWMTWKTVQIRSIQSATGILYAAIVFVLFGEVISLFLQLSTGRPF